MDKPGPDPRPAVSRHHVMHQRVENMIADVGPCGLRNRGGQPLFNELRHHRFDGQRAPIAHGPSLDDGGIDRPTTRIVR